MVNLSTEHIEIDPTICGGRPRIKGTRVRVQDIVSEHMFHGLSPEEIVSAFPRVSLSAVYAALAYYHDHREDIRQAFDNDRELAEKLKANSPSRLEQYLR